MSDSARLLLVPLLGPAGARHPHAGSRRPEACAARLPCRCCFAATRSAAAAAHRDVPARRGAVRAGRRDRHRGARDRAQRAAQLDHELRAELPAVRRVLRRGLPLALHAVGRVAGRQAARPMAHARRPRRGRVRGTARAAVEAAARSSRSTTRPRSSRRPTSSGPGRTSTSNGALAGNRTRATATALAQFLGQTVAANRDVAYSRLLCPRIAPAEPALPRASSSRRSSPAGWRGSASTRRGAASATQIAWVAARPTREFPVYHTLGFGTSTVGDFEYLVRLLKPRPADPKVGVRDVDVQDAGSGVGGIDAPALNNILRMGGALRVPFDPLPQDDQGRDHEVRRMGRAVSRTRSRASRHAGQPAATPISTSRHQRRPAHASRHLRPLACRRRALARRIRLDASTPDERTHWLNELNLDPRYRAAAGIGTTVVQKNQEEYMEAAWQQVGKVLAGNQKVRHSHFAMATTVIWNQQNLVPLRTRQATRVPDGRGARSTSASSPTASPSAIACRKSTVPRGSNVEGDAAGATTARAHRQAHRLRRRTRTRATWSIG